MNFLPTELENIITDYKNQLEHKEKFSKSLKKINNIHYRIEKNNSYDYKSIKNVNGKMVAISINPRDEYHYGITIRQNEANYLYFWTNGQYKFNIADRLHKTNITGHINGKFYQY